MNILHHLRRRTRELMGVEIRKKIRETAAPEVEGKADQGVELILGQLQEMNELAHYLSNSSLIFWCEDFWGSTYGHSNTSMNARDKTGGVLS